jgi:Protein of unknown function (DUF1207)
MRVRAVGVLLAVMVLGRGMAAAQAPDDGRFTPLLADPKEPGFFAAYLWSNQPHLASHIATVGLGQTIGLLRSGDWEVALGAGAFSQFRMEVATNDLMNTDYIVGLPVTWHRGPTAMRFRLFHQSSHMGDEYLLHTGAQRADLTFESAELLVSRETGPWRVYGGGEYAFTRSPSDLEPAVLRAGLEYRGAQPILKLGGGRFGTGRLVAGIDVESVQAQGRQPTWSGVSGLELSVPGSEWRWSVLLKGNTGAAPYGQFYRDRLSSLGLGISFTR